ncbi:MAG: CBS domain-containing protein [Acidobacteriota bacterium]|nr:MAG: CBS domain-containing protein [Acidobacteriota bacterium]
MKVSSRLNNVRIRELTLRPAVLVERDASISETVQSMKAKNYGVALICDHGRLIGIFTERDLLNRVIGENVGYDEPIERVMTGEPQSLSIDDTVADAMQIMQQGDFRNIPLRNGEGKASGVLTVREIISFFAEHFPEEALNLPPDPGQPITQAEGA